MKKRKKRKVRMGVGIFVFFAGVLLSCLIWKDRIQENLKVRAFRMAIDSRSEEEFRKCFDELVRFDESTGTLIPKTEFIRTGMNEAYLAAMRNWLEVGTPLFGEDPFDERMIFFLVGFCSSPSRGGFGYGESPNGFELCNAVIERCRLHGIPAGRRTWTIQRNEDGTVSFRLGAQFECPVAQRTLAVIENGSDDEVWEHRFELWEEWKKHGGRPLRVWSKSTCKRVFDGIADGMTHTDSDKRVCYLFFYLHDFVLMQKEHFDISKMCSDDQFDAISRRLDQYNANVDFLTDKLFIQKVLAPTGETAIQLTRTHVTP